MDFSSLSDDQLLDLLKAAMAEAIKRGGDIASAANSEVLSAQERAAIEFRIAEKIRIEREEKERSRIAKEAEFRMREEDLKRETEKVETEWEVKAAAVKAVREWGYDDEFEINIWSRGADRRVYFQKNSSRKTTAWKWCLYLGGNSYHPPGDFEGEGQDCWFDDKQDELKSLLTAIASSWKGDVSISSCKVGNVTPAPKTLARYLKAVGVANA